MKFVVYRDNDHRWYWELRLPDASAVAKSPLGFSTEAEAHDAVQTIRRGAPGALVFDLVGNLKQGI